MIKILNNIKEDIHVKKIYIFGFLTCLFLFMPNVKARTWSFMDSVYLNPGENTSYSIEIDVGDKFHWSFATHDSSFRVRLSCSNIVEDISYGKSQDNGIINMTVGGTHTFSAHNMDIEDRGWIDITLKNNPDEVIPGYNVIIMISIMSIITIYFKKKNFPSKSVS